MKERTIYPTWEAKVVKGHVYMKHKEMFDRWVELLEGKDVTVTVKKKVKLRSTGKPGEGNQNGYYWSVIVRMVADAMGVFDMQAHGFLAMNFNIVGTEANGKRWEVPGTTTDMSTGAFEDYCSKIRMWAADPNEGLGIYIPLPNEAEYDSGAV